MGLSCFGFRCAATCGWPAVARCRSCCVFGSFVAPPEGFIAALHREINDIALRDLNLLPVETLLIESGQRSLAVDIDMRNTQFIGAHRTDGAFPDGDEPDVLALMDAFLEPKDCFFDVGANWGYMALHCLLRPDFAGRVIAFEPNERPRRDLEHLVAACGFEDRITILPYAIGDAHGAALLSRPAWSGTATVIDTTEGDPVALRTIDELGLPAARLIKVDIEGSEAAFVRGATHYITQHRPLIIFESRIDTPGGDWAGPYALLEALNYHCFAVEADVTASASWSRAIGVTLSPAGPGNRASVQPDLRGWGHEDPIFEYVDAPLGAALDPRGGVLEGRISDQDGRVAERLWDRGPNCLH